jgi:hypothetical protein
MVHYATMEERNVGWSAALDGGAAWREMGRAVEKTAAASA